MKKSQQVWIQAGYELFSQKGKEGLKVEVLAKKVGISKSSFYHHFADLEVFTEILLNYHLERIQLITEREKACQTIIPEMVDVLVEFKIDLLFSRQLRIHRADKSFQACFEKSNQIVDDTFINVWKKDLEFSFNPSLIENLYDIALENFYMQITEENLNFEWLSAYFQGIRQTILAVIRKKS